MTKLAAYATARDRLLRQIVETLSADPRFVAAWLTGSFGRGTADNISDLDLNVVVADEFSQSFCARPWSSGGEATPERYALFSQFGQPALIFEAHVNAPEGGSFTTVIYRESAVIVDWILIPQEQARRPDQCQLLFQKIPIPVQSSSKPESIEQRVQLASQQVAFFWFMAAVIAKYLVRRDALQFNTWLYALRQVMAEVERLVIGQPWQYLPDSPLDLALTPLAQKAALRQLCHEMLNLMPAVEQLGGRVPEDPMPIIEARLALLEDSKT